MRFSNFRVLLCGIEKKLFICWENHANHMIEPLFFTFHVYFVSRHLITYNIWICDWIFFLRCCSLMHLFASSYSNSPATTTANFFIILFITVHICQSKERTLNLKNKKIHIKMKINFQPATVNHRNDNVRIDFDFYILFVVLYYNFFYIPFFLTHYIALLCKLKLNLLISLHS